MIGKIKALGLAFIAITAMSAVAASAAQAVSGEIHVETPNTAVITGVNTPPEQHILSFKNTANETVNSKCTNATLEGTVQGGSPQITLTEATLTPTYSGCKLFGQQADVLTNGCKYTLTASQTDTTATVDVVGCTTGKHIEIVSTVIDCVVTVKEQNNLSHVVFQNEGTTPNTIIAQATVTGIHYESHGTECPDPGTHTGTNAGFEGKTTFRAFVDNGNGTQETAHGHQFTTLAEGAQVGLFAT